MNISFLNPSILWLAPLSLLPLIIHFFFRRRPRRVQFSYLKFIELSARSVTPRKKLYQILLLLARCLIILILCFAFARPTGYIGKTAKEGKNKEIVFLLDSSFSMNYRDAGRKRFAAAKDFILSLCSKILSSSKRTGAMTDVSIVLFSDRIEKYAESMRDVESVRKFLGECREGYSTTDLLTAMNFAYSLLSRFPKSDKAIIPVSDMAEHTFSGGAPELKQRLENYDPEVALVFAEVGQVAFENAFIRNAGSQDASRQIHTELSCFSDRILSRPFTVNLDNRKIYDEEVELEPGEILKKEINYIFEPPHQRKGLTYTRAVLKLQEDSLSEDDSYYSIITLEPPKNVLIVDGEPRLGYGVNSESYYVNAALSEKKSGRFTVKVIGPDEFRRVGSFSKYDVVSLCNLESIPQEALSALEISPPPVIVVFGGKNMKPGLWPEWISENFSGAVTEEKIHLSTFTYSHVREQAGRIFPEIGSFDIEKITFNRYLSLNETNAEVLLKFDNGLPFLILKTHGDSTLYIAASGAGRSWGNFPVKPFFPYFVRSLFGYTHPVETIAVKNTLKIGEPIVYYLKSARGDRLFAVPRQRDNPSIYLPDWSRKPVKKTGTELIFEDTYVPGFYSLSLPGNSPDKVDFAVNTETSKSESDLRKIDRTLLGKIFTGSSIVYIDWNKDALKRAAGALEGVELSGNFLTVVLLLLGIEIALAQKWRSKQ